MRIQIQLCLPLDATSLPLSRRVLGAALTSLGTTDECRDDIQIALAEACGNVVKHATPTDVYQVEIVFDEETCTIEVSDDGPGMDGTLPAEPSPHAESGRGLRMIQMVTDRFELRRAAGGGTVVRFVKRLALASADMTLRTT